jgi:SAM-dependent methyltransferase
MPEHKKSDEIKDYIKSRYGKIAKNGGSCCSGEKSNCCGSDSNLISLSAKPAQMGYTIDDMNSIPQESNLGLGCGNPIGIASIKPGEVVLDLGSGAGMDCFLASKLVGEKGQVIGVDMTESMILKAKQNAQVGLYYNVEFRLGEIECLPVDNNSIDCVISNCVINLSQNKTSVFGEIFRVLKPGGRVAISDIVATSPMPEIIKKSIEAYADCVAGAESINNLMTIMKSLGFAKIEITPRGNHQPFMWQLDSDNEIELPIISANILAAKP